MIILIANIGSTSFKFKLFEMPSERILAQGKVERVGKDDAVCSLAFQDGRATSETRPIASFVEAVDYVVSRLNSDGGSLGDLTAIGFKVIHAKGYSGCRLLTPEVVRAMDEYSLLCPVHNPLYVRAIEDFRRALPDVPLVGLFETAFHQTMPEVSKAYSIPCELAQEHDIRRYGFHGASHRYLRDRYAQLKGSDPADVNIITCHLGGSSSITAIKNGQSYDTSFGFSTQSSIPGSTRSGDIDPYIIPLLVRDSGLGIDRICEMFAKQGGLLGISGLSGEMRDLEEAAVRGNERAQLAIDVFVHSVKKYIGSYIAILPEVEAIVLAGGIGERSPNIREKIISGLERLGLVLDAKDNASCSAEEMVISRPDSPIEVWVIPTDEEIIVAREVCDSLREQVAYSPVAHTGG
jgi:acetate kinase